MELKKEYLEIQAKIREEEAKAEDKKWGAGTWFVNIILVILTGGIWLALMLLYWFLTIDLFPWGKKRKLEELYSIRDEVELKLRGV